MSAPAPVEPTPAPATVAQAEPAPVETAPVEPTRGEPVTRHEPEVSSPAAPAPVEIARAEEAEEEAVTVPEASAPAPVTPPAPALPTDVSSRSTPPEAGARGGYVIEPPAYGGGEPRDPADTSAADLLDPEYRIGVEDLLDVSVLGESDLQHLALRVSPRGTVDFPYAGTLTAAGLTVDEFRNELIEKLVDYFVAPQLTVFLREYRSRMVHVLGEVPRPGPFKLTHRNTLMEVLSRAGGFTPLANKSDVQVIRQDSAGKRVIRVDVNAIIDDGQLDLDIPLEAGDVINVPERIF